MDEQDIDKITEALKVALKNVLITNQTNQNKENATQETNTKPQTNTQENTQTQNTQNTQKLSVKDLIKQLNDMHKSTHDFLQCPTCRPLFEESIKQNGWVVEDKPDQIIIRKRKV